MTEKDYLKRMYGNFFPAYLGNQSLTSVPCQIDWKRSLEDMVLDINPRLQLYAFYNRFPFLLQI